MNDGIIYWRPEQPELNKLTNLFFIGKQLTETINDSHYYTFEMDETNEEFILKRDNSIIAIITDADQDEYPNCLFTARIMNYNDKASIVNIKTILAILNDILIKKNIF